NGDRRAALRKLEVLSQDEPFAPRIWTALGEAHLELIAVAPDNTDPRELARHRAMAQTALERAVKQERRPAEAMVRLAEIWTSRRREDPEAAQKSLELLEQAVKINDRLPRYKERLGLALDFLGYRK